MEEFKANDILSKYMEAHHNQNYAFQQNLASNAVLDWFGRTVKGHKNIQKFFECYVWPHYDQDFVAAVECSPIESRPSHELTKHTSFENAIHALPAIGLSDYESPSSDLQNDRSSSPMKRSKVMLSSMNEESGAVNRSIASFVCDLGSNPCSELNYLESIGSLRVITYPKYPNINKVHTVHTARGALPTLPIVWLESRGNYDRWYQKIKLKISYRKHRMDSIQKADIQFALIRYEALEKIPKRNLLNEFDA